MLHALSRAIFLLCTSLLISRLSFADEFSARALPLHALHERSEVDADRLQAAALVMEARILERRGKLAVAVRKYQRAWRLDPDNAQVVLKQIVPLALRLGRVAEATRYSLLLTNSDLNDPFLAERLAMLMANQMEYDRSLQLYRHVLQLRANDPESRNPIAMHFEMGRLYFLTSKFQQANQSFRVVLEALDDPQEHRLSDEVRNAILAEPSLVFNLIAESFLDGGEYEAAKRMFERASESRRTTGWLTFQRARVDYRAGRYRDAQEQLETYVKQKMRMGDWTPYQLLQSVMEKTTSPGTEQPSAIVQFRDWLVQDPENFPLLSFVADLTRRRGVLKDAVALYEKSIAVQPTVEAYEGLIATYRQLRDAGELLKVLAKVVLELKSLASFSDEVEQIVSDAELLDDLFAVGRQSSDTADAMQGGGAAACAMMAIQAKRFDVADEFFAKMGEAKAEHELWVNCGIQLMIAGESSRAVSTFQIALGSKPEPSDKRAVQYYLSGALQLEGKIEEALKMARRAVDLSKDNLEIDLRPAWILYSADRIDEAAVEYVAWLEKYAEDYSMPGSRANVREARFVMSSIYLEQNRVEEAVESLEKVLDEFPQDVAAANDLGFLLVDHGKSLERATKMIRFAVEAEPDNVAYRDSLGWALYRSGKFEEAVAELQKADSDEVPDPIILDHLGDAFRSNGDEESARGAWQRALSLMQDDASHTELIQTINTKLEKELAESR